METENVKEDAFWSRTLVVFFCVAIAISVGTAFYKFFVLRDYSIQTQVDCDPSVDSCFVLECTPDSDGVTGDCTGDPEQDTHYYKIMQKNVANVYDCTAGSDGCPTVTCDKNETGCGYTYCEQDNTDGVTCSQPQAGSTDQQTDITPTETAP